MNRFKSLMVLLGFLTISSMARAQGFWAIENSICSPFISSSGIKSTLGIGVSLGTYYQKKIAHQWDLYSELSYSEGYMFMDGFSYDDNNLTVPAKNKIEDFVTPSVYYTIGTQYEIVPNVFGAKAGLSGGLIQFNDVFNDGDGLGTPPADLSQPFMHVENLGGTFQMAFDYGIQAGLNWRINNIMLSLGYYRGFSNITNGYGFNSNINNLSFTINYIIVDQSFSKPYENKMLK